MKRRSAAITIVIAPPRNMVVRAHRTAGAGGHKTAKDYARNPKHKGRNYE